MAAIHVVKKRLVNLTVVLLSATVSAGQKQIVGVEVKFFDKFESEANLPYAGGHIEIKCKLDAAPCLPEDKVELQLPNGKKIGSPCEGDAGKFRVNITNQTASGDYKCVLNRVASASVKLNFRYRLCDQNECAKVGQCKEPFCIVKGKEEANCSRPPDCGDQHQFENPISRNHFMLPL